MHSTHPLIAHPVELWRDVQKEEEERVESTETNKIK